MEEVWKSVGVFKGIDYTGSYEASTFGNIRSIDRTVIYKNGKRYNYKGQMLNPQKNSKGYFHVILYYNGKPHTCLIHQLVMNTHNPNPDPEIYTDINHIDEDKTNNRLDNLEWTTHKENNNHGTHNKRVSNSLRKTLGREVVQLDLNLKFIKKWDSVALIHELTGYSDNAIQNCLLKLSKSSSGYIWVYAEEYYSNNYLSRYETGNDITYSSSSRKSVQMDLDCNFIKQWDSVKEASEAGYTSSRIYACLNGDRNKHHGFRWVYLEDYEQLRGDKVLK